MMLLMTRSFIFALALFSVGCETVEPSNLFQVSSDFNDQRFDVLQEEADTLCDLTLGQHCMFLTRGEFKNKVVVQPGMGTVAGDTRIVSGTESKITIRIDSEDLGDLRHIFRHEMGHALGCPVHLPEGNVMYRDVSSADWTEADLACLD